MFYENLLCIPQMSVQAFFSVQLFVFWIFHVNYIRVPGKKRNSRRARSLAFWSALFATRLNLPQINGSTASSCSITMASSLVACAAEVKENCSCARLKESLFIRSVTCSTSPTPETIASRSSRRTDHTWTASGPSANARRTLPSSIKPTLFRAIWINRRTWPSRRRASSSPTLAVTKLR